MSELSECTHGKTLNTCKLCADTMRGLRERIAELEAQVSSMDKGNAYIENGVLLAENKRWKEAVRYAMSERGNGVFEGEAYDALAALTKEEL